MCDDWGRCSGIGYCLLHRVEHVQVLNPFDFEVKGGELGADHISISRGTAILLTAKRLEKARLAEHIAPEPLDPFTFLPGVHGNALPIRPCAQRTISSSE